MKTIIIFGHPTAENSVMNKKMLDLVKDNVTVHDISKLQLTPEVIKQEQELLGQYDKIVFQYPAYWFTYPALVASYLEKVFTPPKFYRYDDKPAEYAGKTLGFVITTGSPRAFYNTEKVGYMVGQMRMIPDFCRMKFAGYFVMCSDEIDQENRLKEYVDFIQN